MQVQPQSEKSLEQASTTTTSNRMSQFELFLAGFMFDESCNFCDLPKDVLYVICTSTHLRFTFEYDFDQKGVLSWLRTGAFTSLDKARIILRPGREHVPSLNALGNESRYMYTRTLPNKEIWSYIDLQCFKLRISHFSFCIDQNLFYSLFAFYQSIDVNFQGSNDLVTWERIYHIREEDNNEEESENLSKYMSSNCASEKTWRFRTSGAHFFRYVKIPFLIDRHYLPPRYATIFSGLEVYGDLI
jgi:hypothetical protein